MSRYPRRTLRFVSVLALLVGLLTAVAAGPVAAAPVTVAADLTATGPVGLTNYTNAFTDAFTSDGDGFQKYQRGVSPSIPFSVLDDSLVTFPADTLGIVDDNNAVEFFGVTDTVNADTSGPVSATWEFDIAGASDLALSIDMGAMGDFETADSVVWSYSIDGGATSTAFSLVVDEAGTRDYTLAGGAVISLDDPMNVDGVELSNVLQPVSTTLAGSGSSLSLTLTVTTDGGSEGFAFQNIIITGDDAGGPTGPVPGDLVITEIMQNPFAVGDSAGEWFEIANVSASDVDIEGWTFADLGTNNHTISNGGPLVVPAGGYLVLGNNTDSATNGGVAVAYSYGPSFALANGDDEIVLSDPAGLEFDRVEYDGGPVFPDPNGASMALDPGALDTTGNDDGSNWCEGATPFGAGDLGTPGSANEVCPEEPVLTALIHEVQGSGPSVAITGPVNVQAVVTSLFTRDDVLDGFFIQEEDVDADADPATSEGIFVFCRGNCPAELAEGDLVTVEGNATDFFGMSQISADGGTITIDGSGLALPSATSVDLPAAGSTLAEETFEAVEGMVVSFPAELVVSEYFELARYGQVVLTESSRPYQFTHSNFPSASGYAAFLDDLARRRIILDDDNNDQNDPISDGADEAYYYPEGGLSVTNRFRGGDTVKNLTGVMHWSFAGQSGTDAWRVRPVPDAFDYSFKRANKAPKKPAKVGGSMTVASFNVLNYFTTLDTGPGACGPTGTDGCRGANSTAELDRQRAKIVAALATIDADIVGLIELENDGDDSSIADLVAALNSNAGAGTYDYVATGFIGSDAIKVGLIYRPSAVSPVGSFAILDSSVDPTFLDTKNRPVLVQTFAENSTGEQLTVAVNHLKSKGSACDDVGDPGLNDGQANCAGTRTAAAIALANYLATDPTGSGDPDFLILGDLNSYAMEDPIQALVAAGYTDLLGDLGSDGAYSYLFDGQLGYLDYAMSNASLTAQVTGATSWNINADEVPLFDYNDDIQDPGESSFNRESGVLPIYAPDALRSSDHDPVIIGLALESAPATPTCFGQPATIVGTDGRDIIWGTNGDDVIVTMGGRDLVWGRAGDDLICTGDGDDYVFGSWGDDQIDAGAGRDALFGGWGNDHLDGGADRDRGTGGAGIDSCVSVERVRQCES